MQDVSRLRRLSRVEPPDTRTEPNRTNPSQSELSEQHRASAHPSRLASTLPAPTSRYDSLTTSFPFGMTSLRLISQHDSSTTLMTSSRLVPSAPINTCLTFVLDFPFNLPHVRIVLPRVPLVHSTCNLVWAFRASTSFPELSPSIRISLGLSLLAHEARNLALRSSLTLFDPLIVCGSTSSILGILSTSVFPNPTSHSFTIHFAPLLFLLFLYYFPNHILLLRL